MSFHPEKVEDFKAIFDANKEAIKNFKGCSHVELLQDTRQNGIFFTYSIWQSEDHLNAYRDSALFEKVWSATKALFNNKPEAWTVDPLFP